MQRERLFKKNNSHIVHFHDMGKTFKGIRTLLDKNARINVCKTVDFIIDNRLVCDRSLCPKITKLLYYMYTNQECSVR